jgi:MSHA biogenesis protein MshO
MMRRPRSLRRSGGFTLVEAVMVIAIIGIIGGIVAVFIRAPILSYRDMVDRAELTDQADLALRRMARDIRLALPNSVRVNSTGDHPGDHLELLLTRSGARYLAAEDGLAPDQVLSFDNPADTSFSALSPPTTFTDVRIGDFVVVYNLGPGMSPGDAYNFDATGDINGNVGRANNKSGCPAASAATAAGNIARICALNPSPADTSATRTVLDPVLNMQVRNITLAGNPFARQDTPLQSPQQRFQVVSGPVSFYCAQNTDGRLALWRAWDYPITAAQAVPTGGKRALVATGLSTCDDIFAYGTAASQRTGLVRIALSLRGRTDSPATIRLVHQVHVDNTP